MIKIEDILVSTLFWLIDKIPPLKKFIEKFISPIKVSPRKLNFINSEWSQKQSFVVTNIVKQKYDIYFSISLNKLSFTDVILDFPKEDNLLVLSAGDIIYNYSYTKYLLSRSGSNYILIKIHTLKPNQSITFFVSSKVESNLEIKVLESSDIESKVLFTPEQAALNFKIPKSFGEGAILNGVELMLRKK